ncbi:MULTISPECIES: hypothetical protein [Wolbachia]|uniref:hypothetical protein n=1 Tax=unclassified Wolbachia TaxID=2640676 RepID=UPI000A647B8B|nr:MULTISPECIES: hypothetical protein [unclassified Wolbachia]RLT59808.1 hypothetical protein WANA13_1175 [Wolbachia endosymbiont of Drosophila ananassae]
MSGHWDDTIGGYLDDKKRSTGMTAVLRHTAAVSLDPANKQRDDELIVTPPRTVIPRFIRGISAANK